MWGNVFAACALPFSNFIGEFRVKISVVFKTREVGGEDSPSHVPTYTPEYFKVFLPSFSLSPFSPGENYNAKLPSCCAKKGFERIHTCSMRRRRVREREREREPPKKKRRRRNQIM